MLVAGCCACSVPVLAASPRDAVKTLPRVSHTSDFHLTTSDSENSHSYEDTYTDTWDLNWQPRPLDLPVGRVSLELHYLKQLGDRLQRSQGASADTRLDQYNFTVRLEQAGFFKGHFAIEEVDTRSGSYPTDSPPSFSARTRKEAYLAWAPPGFPSMAAIHSVTTTANYAGTVRNHSDEVEWTQLQLNYLQNSALASQQLQYLGELTHSYNFYPARTGTSNSKQIWDATRQMPLGGIGSLQVGAHLEENHRRQDTEADSTDINTAQCSLGLNGNVASFPLNYDIGYLSSSQSINNENSNERSQRRLTLTFSPPVPAGKRAGLSYSNVYDEYSDTYRDTSIETQRLNWNFSPNQRVSSSLGYELNTTVDRLLHMGTEENETVSGALSYTVPGNRGSFASSATQNIQRKPDEDSRVITNSVNLSSNIQLGQKAAVTLFYTQSYSDNRQNYLATPATADYLLSGVNYQINPGQGVSLNAKWQQQYRLNLPSERKSATQTIEVTFNWQTPANWNYALKIRGTDDSTVPGGTTGTTYEAGDEVQALITYSF
jgi:hypothetical protein